MRISFVIVLALASALLIAPSAGAKGVTKMEVCGAAQCVALPGDGDDFEALMIGSSAAGPPEGPAGWYSVRSTVTPSREQGEDFEPFTFREAYVPSAGLLRVRAEDGGFQWFDVSARYEAAMKKATAGLEPRPAGRLAASISSRWRRRWTRSFPLRPASRSMRGPAAARRGAGSRSARPRRD